MSMSGIQFKMRQRLIQKFRKAGATSWEKAVTFDEAKLDLQEKAWSKVKRRDILDLPLGK